MFSAMDGTNPLPEGQSYALAYENMQSYFKVNNQHDMLPHMYTTFNKSYIAAFTAVLSEGRSELTTVKI